MISGTSGGSRLSLNYSEPSHGPSRSPSVSEAVRLRQNRLATGKQNQN